MAEKILTDGTVGWVGGMDTSRQPTDIGEVQYSKATNVIIPSSLGGIKSRFGIHCAELTFRDKNEQTIYSKGNIQGEGWFAIDTRIYLIAVVDGYIFRFRQTASNSFNAELININDRNQTSRTNAWVITVPGGCIVNNGFDLPIYITETNSRRTDPLKGEIGIGQMGVYVQHRLFVVDQSGRRILASDYNQPLMFTREFTNIFGFMNPDEDEVITAIGKQKSIIGTVEGGNLIWSSNKDIYSADVRGSRTDWANLGSSVGKTTETVPGFSAASSTSFESFNTNMYFRTKQFGIADLRQSEFQFTGQDAPGNQSIEASYYLDRDTDWMLSKCYTRACNKRLYTTVAPERNEHGYIYWNGILSMHPASRYSNQGDIPRRFESVFTGVRPWCLTTVAVENTKDKMYIHSFDGDGMNRLYLLNEDSDFDVDRDGKTVEIQGYIETRAYTHQNPLLFKAPNRRFYRLNSLSRSVDICVFSRPESHGEWVPMYGNKHLVGRVNIENHTFSPSNHKPQTRAFVNMGEEKFSECYKGRKFLSIQYRVEFTGPIYLDSLIVAATIDGYDATVTPTESQTIYLTYSFRPDFNYQINPHL